MAYRRRRARPPLRRRDERRAWRRSAALRAERGHLRPRALPGDARVQGDLRPARADEPRQEGRRAADDREPPLRSRLQAARDQDPPRLHHAKAASCRAVEMCNGAAVCRKLKAGTMCPSYMATKDENDTTRARANALRNALAGRGGSTAPTSRRKATYDVMDLCLSCKACKTECPSSVDMAKTQDRVPGPLPRRARHAAPRPRLRSHPHDLAADRSDRAAGQPVLANAACPAGDARASASTPSGSSHRSRQRTFVTRWRRHVKHQAPERQTRGKVVYFHDTFTTYNYPRIGLAAVKLLEAAGFEVIVEERRACCGRPMLSKGLVGDARKVARKNVDAARPSRPRRHPDHRHRTELHPDPARRIPRPPPRRP